MGHAVPPYGASVEQEPQSAEQLLQVSPLSQLLLPQTGPVADAAA
jgi:hypothetical protein